jgi:hypothetical protein
MIGSVGLLVIGIPLVLGGDLNAVGVVLGNVSIPVLWVHQYYAGINLSYRPVPSRGGADGVFQRILPARDRADGIQRISMMTGTQSKASASLARGRQAAPLPLHRRRK